MNSAPRYEPARTAAPAAGLIAAAAIAAYAGSFRAPFVFDDLPAIAGNAAIRHFGSALRPLGDASTTAGRPILSLSLAINYALSADQVWSYHALNLVIHILAGLTLFGIVRRTLRDDFIGLAVALVWTVHPLQTESVTYVIQRAESLMGLFYLLTLYCFIRWVESETRQRFAFWSALSVLACLLGMATKEVMVSAPLIVFLYDRTFVAHSFREAWKRRRLFYLALAATWLVLAASIRSTGGNRGGSIGFGLPLDWWSYELTQFPAIAHYLRLCVWPHPLVFNYEAFSVPSLGHVWPSALLVLTLVASTIWALRARPTLGFLGVSFFAILAPTSLVPGVNQMIAEHRMYLPLAAALGFLIPLAAARFESQRLLRSCVLGIVVAGLVAGTFQRNSVYGSALGLWADTVAKRPSNPAARVALGNALVQSGQNPEAIVQYEAALANRPDYADAHYNLGITLKRVGRLSQAIAELEAATRLKPSFAGAHFSLGDALDDAGKKPEAIAEYGRAVALQPADAAAHYNLGLLLNSQNRPAEAIPHFEAAVRLRPDDALAHNNLAISLAQSGRIEDAIREFREAIKADPRYAAAHNNLAFLLHTTGRDEEARRELDAAAQLGGPRQPGGK